MSIPGSAAPFLLAQPPSGEYQIERSLRFNSADSAYLSRTPASTGNRKTWTWAGWVKRTKSTGDGGVAAYQVLFEATGASVPGTRTSFMYNGDQLDFFTDNTSSSRLITAQVFRDFSAWQHIVLRVDTTQGTTSNRVRIYINGTQITVFNTASYPNLNLDTAVNTNTEHRIGKPYDGFYYDGYLAEVHLVDGQSLDPTSFGEFDTNGVWQPIEYVGSYGTNGFYLPFSNNSSASALGTDASGNGNNWNVNNISVVAGATNDSLVDSPTNYGTDTGAGGEVRGNYATLNELYTNATLSNGNLDIAGGGGDSWAHATIGLSSGKWYAEMRSGGGTVGLGIYSLEAILAGGLNAAQSRGYFYTGAKYSNGGTSAYGNSYTVNDTIGIAIDVDAGKVWFSKNGVWQASGDPAAGTNPAFSDIANNTWFITPQGVEWSASMNFGQRSFAYTAPSGFNAVCTTNLPQPTILDGSTAMDMVLYASDGNPRTISGLKFSPDMVWSKRRSSTNRHVISDIVRGVNKEIHPDLPDAERTSTDGLLQFNSDGYNLGSDSGEYGWQSPSQTFINWAWDAGSSTVSNTDGSITSTIRANPNTGLSIVTWTGNGSTGATIGHGLGVTPGMIVLKSRDDGTYEWPVWHTIFGTSTNKKVLFSRTDSEISSDSNGYVTSVNSTTFGFGGGTAAVNASGQRYVAYVFAPIEGYSAFGKFVTNGTTNNRLIYTGFKPKYFVLKCVTAGGSWPILDTKRSPFNLADDYLLIEANGGETVQGFGDFVSNGFKLRSNAGTLGTSGNQFLFFAFAEHPFRSARAH